MRLQSTPRAASYVNDDWSGLPLSMAEAGISLSLPSTCLRTRVKDVKTRIRRSIVPGFPQRKTDSNPQDPDDDSCVQVRAGLSLGWRSHSLITLFFTMPLHFRLSAGKPLSVIVRCKRLDRSPAQIMTAASGTIEREGLRHRPHAGGPACARHRNRCSTPPSLRPSRPLRVLIDSVYPSKPACCY